MSATSGCRAVCLVAVMAMPMLIGLVRTGQLNATEPVEIAVIGDYGAAAFGWSVTEGAVADLVKNWKPHFIMTLGDNNYLSGGADTIDVNIGQFYHEFIHPYYGSYGSGAVSNRFFPALGNHDYNTSGAQPYLDYFTLPGNERYYNYRYGPVEIFALNSELEPDGVLSNSVQAVWLRERLAMSGAPWKLVYFHSSPYSSGPHGPSEWMQWPYAEWGATCVLSGHDHIYERVEWQGMTYLVNGLGGFGAYSLLSPSVPGSVIRFNRDHGAIRIAATATNIMFEFVTRSNLVVDRISKPTRPSGYPAFLQYPSSRAVRPGAFIQFSTVAEGENVRYQWRLNGTELPGETNDILSLSSVSNAQRGAYTVLLSNHLGQVLSTEAHLKLIYEPTILRHPTNHAVLPGTNVTFAISAEGVEPLSYQWRFNGHDIAGATNSTLSLTNVQLTDNGDYDVAVWDVLGLTISRPGKLTVLVRASVLQHPIAQSAVEGAAVVFSVAVSASTLPLTYRWMRGSQILTHTMTDELVSFLTVTNVGTNDARNYRVGVSNQAGISFSGPAALTLLPDDDSDGLPNAWEQHYHLLSDDPQDALADADDDQMSNTDEYIAGTDPRDPASYLKVEALFVTKEGPSRFLVHFAAVSNRTYTIQRRTGLQTVAWEHWRDIPAAATNRVLQLLDETKGSKPEAFYRVTTPRRP